MPTKLEGPGPFHEGEITLQEATGEREAGAGNGRIIADRLPPNAAGFIARQELAALATVDGDGQPWCSPLLGPAGSFAALDPGRLALRRAAARADDPLWDNLTRDPRVGLLFLEAARRRRYRVNGRVADPGADPLVVEIAEALGNCPRYITARHLVVDPAGAAAIGPAAAGGADLGAAERAIIAAADMAFVASANPAGQLDASHRGGRPGFVEWRDGRLWIPDYPGNSMFMTLGNLAVHPAAGLLFIDFSGGQTLQLTGATSIDLEADDAAPTGGTGRAWTFTPTSWRRAPLPAPVHAELLELSPFNP